MNIDVGASPTQLEFLFIGGNLALDLVNTKRSRRIDGSWQVVQFDQLWDEAQAGVWWNRACERHYLRCYEAYVWGKEAFELLIELREELRALFESLIAGDVGSVGCPLLNGILSRGSFSLSVSREGLRREYASREGKPDPLLDIALAAQELLAERDLSRLRGCRSELCVLLFYDSTKSGTRHWCRPSCMNRARARANYRKAKEGREA